MINKGAGLLPFAKMIGRVEVPITQELDRVGGGTQSRKTRGRRDTRSSTHIQASSSLKRQNKPGVSPGLLSPTRSRSINEE
jgi:hypothetical protein